MYKKIIKFSIIVFSASLLLVNLGCTSEAKENDENNQEEKDENIVTTDNVLDNMFNAPNEDFQEAMKLKKDNPSDGEEEKFLSAYNQFMEDTFKPYVADEYYDEFTVSYGPEFLKIANSKNYEMNVKFPEYEKANSDENIYDFTFQLQFRQDSSDQWEDRTVNGQVNLNNNNKIESMEIKDAKFLLDMK